MACYFVVTLKIHDQEEYDKYLEQFDSVFSGSGEILAVDESPSIIEGSPSANRAVIIKFSDRKSFEGWYYSEGYQGIIRHRLKAAESEALLVEGYDD